MALLAETQSDKHTQGITFELSLKGHRERNVFNGVGDTTRKARYKMLKMKLTLTVCYGRVNFFHYTSLKWSWLAHMFY